MFYKINLTSLILFITIILMKILSGQESIRVNQIGFYPQGPKFAVAVETTSDLFYITTVDLSDTLYTGTLGNAQTWSHSLESVKLIDFTDFQETGIYTILVEDLGQSHPFSINDCVHQSLSAATIKGYYFQRASQELLEQYAGVWNRPAGHPDTQVRIHASAATPQRPQNTFIYASKGWYDAGDYNKYIVNAGISTYTILAAYEHFPEYYRDFELNIPNSGSAIPDILDEALWSINWMFNMQDPNDGGVYHKLTTENFSGIEMPHEATATRYVVQKSTAATLDFAAIMAQASRIFQEYSSEMIGFSQRCLSAALTAWRWARHNPDIVYDQNAMNELYDPNINTGVYGDFNLTDEFQWAAAELFITTKEDSFLAAYNPLAGSFDVPEWYNVKTLGLYSLVFHRVDLGSDLDTAYAKSILLNLANNLRNEVSTSAYHIVMGKSSGNFKWGSNGVAANQGMTLIQAYNLTGDPSYLDAALQNLDYLLGRNGVGYCFVTGFGSNSPMHPHHRPSEADDVVAPVPGLMAGGPNPNMEDGCSGYIGTERARAYVDSWCSYASNEIAINWNAPLAYTTGAIEALYSQELTTITYNRREIIPDGFILQQNYPNPFNPSTNITYSLPIQGKIDLRVYDITGQLVKTLQNKILPKGEYTITWNGDNDNGIQVSSGIYIVQLRFTSGEWTRTYSKKMSLLR